MPVSSGWKLLLKTHFIDVCKPRVMSPLKNNQSFAAKTNPAVSHSTCQNKITADLT